MTSPSRSALHRERGPRPFRRFVEKISTEYRAALAGVLAVGQITPSIMAVVNKADADIEAKLDAERAKLVRLAEQSAVRFDLLAARFRGCEAERPDAERHALSIFECEGFAEECRNIARGAA